MEKCITKLELGLMRVNTYIVTGENGGATVIDPGAEIGAINKALSELGARAENVLITHGHYDHIGCVSELQRSGAKVIISQIDHELLEKTDFMLGLGVPVSRFSADMRISDGERFTLNGHSFKAIGTPGHTPGSMCYLMDGKTLFSGDTLFCGGIGRFDFPYGSGKDILRSLAALISIDGDIDVCPGHGAVTTIEYERENNPYVRI